MATNRKLEEAEPLAPDEPGKTGQMPTEGDKVREVGRRALDDVSRGRQDTDQAGRDEQRRQAPPGAPTKRSGIDDGSDS